MADVTEKFDREPYLTGVDWRWTAAPSSVVGLDVTVLLGIPLFFAFQLSLKVIYLWIVYVAFVAFVRGKYRLTPLQYFRMLLTKYVDGNSWFVR